MCCHVLQSSSPIRERPRLIMTKWVLCIAVCGMHTVHAKIRTWRSIESDGPSVVALYKTTLGLGVHSYIDRRTPTYKHVPSYPKMVCPLSNHRNNSNIRSHVKLERTWVPALVTTCCICTPPKNCCRDDHARSYLD